MKKIYKGGNSLIKFQGDVSIVAISDDKAKDLLFKPLGKNGYVVAVGETTGNKHVVVADKQAKIEIAEDANGVFLRVLEGTGSLTGHREHEDFIGVLKPLKQQIYWIGRKREYDPILKFRQVQD